MPRLLLILLVAAILLPAPQSAKETAVESSALLIRATPLALNASDPAQEQVGRLRYLGGWDLTSDHPVFGGLSSMVFAPDGGLLALSDSGELFGFDPQEKDGGQHEFVAPLPLRAAERNLPKWKWDSESLVSDPASGRYWVGFELINRVCRYAPAFARIESCHEPEAMEEWPVTGGAEAMVRLPDGRFLVFSEFAYGPKNSKQLLLFNHDPAEPGPPPALLGYYPPQGYRVTDAVWLGDDRLITLNRRVTIYDGFTAKLAMVDISGLKPGKLVHAEEIATLRRPLLTDNFEALAISREHGEPIIWVASDDNHKFFERTLLLKFELLPECAHEER